MAEFDLTPFGNNTTVRETVPALEAVMNKPYNVLDHGFVRCVDYMGGDAAIVRAARVSYGKGTKSVNEDRGLIRYLMRHDHTTPLEMASITFHAKLPIFVARQWIRHRTASVNEYSARYSVLNKEFYIPHQDRCQTQSKTNKQGSGDCLSRVDSEKVLSLLKEDALRCYDNYEKMLDVDLSRELARINLPVNFYSEFYWKIDLHNLLRTLRLRMDSHAQYEIQVYANAMADVVRKWCPLAYEAFEDYIAGAKKFSRMELELLEDWLVSKVDPRVRLDKDAIQSWYGLTKREQGEFFAKVGQE